ncbi:MAG TPA: phosphoglucosamine mutase [Bacillota bacterium]|nr:phosphoglucosamine mutase [Bacillota bacterium]
MSKYFGTDGFRGEANAGLTVEHAFSIGRFLGWYYGKENKARIAIGKDTRISGDMYESALAAGITASGADAYLLRVVSTPGLAYATRNGDFECGVMISASHNPFHDNGIKLINRDGEKMEESVIEAIEKYLDSDLIAERATGDSIGRVIEYPEGVEAYERFLIKSCPVRMDGIRIALDCANGSASRIAPGVFSALGASIEVLNADPDGININAGCGSTHMKALKDFVRENRMDAGFAFDGDADRCLGVDENGDTLDGDMALYICAKFLKQKGEFGSDSVVTTVMANLGLYKALDAIGISYETTDVGDKYVYENMKANGHMLGGEQSGHTIFSKYATTGDGVLTALQLMRVYVESGESFSSLKSDVRIYPQLLKNVSVTDKDAALNCSEVTETCARIETALGGNGRILLRKSGTEPVLRIMVEASTDEICEDCANAIIAAMDKAGMLIEIK